MVFAEKCNNNNVYRLMFVSVYLFYFILSNNEITKRIGVNFIERENEMALKFNGLSHKTVY